MEEMKKPSILAISLCIGAAAISLALTLLLEQPWVRDLHANFAVSSAALPLAVVQCAGFSFTTVSVIAILIWSCCFTLAAFSGNRTAKKFTLALCSLLTMLAVGNWIYFGFVIEY